MKLRTPCHLVQETGMMKIRQVHAKDGHLRARIRTARLKCEAAAAAAAEEEEEEAEEEEEEEGQRDEEQGGKASNETYVPSEPPTDYGSLERSWEYSYDYETLNMAVYDDYRYNLICDVWH